MTSAEITRKFFAVTDTETKNTVLVSVAEHYGITKEAAFTELIDEEAESLLDYLTGTTRTAVSLLLHRHGLV